MAQSAHEVVDGRHMGQDVVADQQVGGQALPDEIAGERLAEELDVGWNPARRRRGGHIGGRLDPEAPDPALDEILEQVAVVAGNLDDLAGAVQVQPRHDRRDVVSRVGQPRVGVRREVGVVAEDLFRRGAYSQLHEKARVADVDPLRVERLHLPQSIGCQVGVRQRRDAEVHEQPLQRRAAEPAAPAGQRRAGAIVLHALTASLVGQIFQGAWPEFHNCSR